VQIIRPNSNFDFVSKNRIAVFVSLIIILIGLVSLIAKGGPLYGIDFAGGTLIQVQFNERTEVSDIRDALQDLALGSYSVQQFGDAANEFLIRTPEVNSELRQISHQVRAALEEKFGAEQLEIRRTETVGSLVGHELRQKGFLALAYAMAGTLAYISWRFEFRFAVAAIIALLHDVIITLGFFSVYDKEMDLTSIAAFLTIIGYSLNDTIVVYDRIRENVRKCPHESFATVVNRSLNETLSRTIMTSGTTLLVVIPLFVFGGTVINGFAFALLVGIIAGTYSSIFVASALIIAWEEKFPRKLLEKTPPEAV